MFICKESAPFYWEFITVDIDVQENGDMLVTETQKYVFVGGNTTGCYRWIPLDKVDSIDSVEVSEGGRTIPTITGVKNNQLWIKWRYHLSPPESRTFVLKYRVIGGLHIHDSGDHVYWTAIFKDRDAPIQSGKVTVRVSESLSGKILGIESFGVPADAHQVDARTVEFLSREPLPPGRELEVWVTFLHGILKVPAPAWQEKD